MFQFTGVFEPGCGQEEVFSQAVSPLLAKVKAGGNCTVLACGQTGSGKSHTIGTHPSRIRVGTGFISHNNFNYVVLGTCKIYILYYPHLHYLPIPWDKESLYNHSKTYHAMGRAIFVIVLSTLIDTTLEIPDFVAVIILTYSLICHYHVMNFVSFPVW